MRPALFLCFVCACSLSAQTPRRSFDTLFPGLDPDIKARAFSGPASFEPQSDEEKGYSHCVTNPADFTIAGIPAAALFSGAFAERAFAGDFSHISENLLVVPYAEAVTLLDIYNALQRVGGMARIKYHSFTRKKWVPLFAEASRIDGPDSLKPLPDPARLPAIPDAETVYVKLKDINLGNTIYRSELTRVNPGNALLYTITNHKASTLLFITVMKSEQFVSRVYLEPLEEGILVSCVAGIRLSGFVERMIDVPSALKKRLDVLIEWALAGL